MASCSNSDVCHICCLSLTVVILLLAVVYNTDMSCALQLTRYSERFTEFICSVSLVAVVVHGK